jgi:sporulation protein YqfC
MSRAKNQKTSKKTFSEKLSATLDIPSDIFDGGCYFELRGRNDIMVRGCRKILKYTPTNIILQMKSSAFSICGDRLVCMSYYVGAVGIKGRIDRMEFLEEGYQ